MAMRLYGSLNNRLMEYSRHPEPEVGMGATVTYWSDRHAATIVAVRRFKTGTRAGQVRQIDVQMDKAVRIDKRGMTEAQSYRFERDPEGEVQTFHLTIRGWRSTKGGLLIGTRSEYYDYGF